MAEVIPIRPRDLRPVQAEDARDLCAWLTGEWGQLTTTLAEMQTRIERRNGAAPSDAGHALSAMLRTMRDLAAGMVEVSEWELRAATLSAGENPILPQHLRPQPSAQRGDPRQHGTQHSTNRLHVSHDSLQQKGAA